MLKMNAKRRPTSQDVNDRVAAGKGVEERKVGGRDSTSSAREGAGGIRVEGDVSTRANSDNEAGDLVDEPS